MLHNKLLGLEYTEMLSLLRKTLLHYIIKTQVSNNRSYIHSLCPTGVHIENAELFSHLLLRDWHQNDNYIFVENDANI